MNREQAQAIADKHGVEMIWEPEPRDRLKLDCTYFLFVDVGGKNQGFASVVPEGSDESVFEECAAMAAKMAAEYEP